MGVYKLSKAAKNDLINIYEYGIETFFYDQALQLYLMPLHKHFFNLGGK